MNISAEVNRIQIGEKSRALREKLVDRTPKSAEVSRLGEASLAQEVVQTVDLPPVSYTHLTLPTTTIV